MRIVEGRSLAAATPGLLAGHRQRYARVVVDVGTGDARAAHRLARAHPDWLVVGLDPAWQRMTETASRAARKPAKGGAANLLLVCASVEQAPVELHGIADEVLALMPWGRLLRGIVLGEADVCGGLRALARPLATLDVTVGTSIWRQPVPLEIRDLPELTEAYAREPLAGRLAAAGWRLSQARRLAAGESAGAAPLASSWARRLADPAVRTETFLHLRAVAEPG